MFLIKILETKVELCTNLFKNNTKTLFFVLILSKRNFDDLFDHFMYGGFPTSRFRKTANYLGQCISNSWNISK